MAMFFLKSVAQALLNYGTFGVGGFLADVLPRVAESVWEAWGKERQEEQRREELEAVARAGVEAIRREAAKVLDEVAAGAPPERRQEVEHFLLQIPATIQRSLRRPSDPTGTSLPLVLTPRSADDLMPLLPERVSRFRPGMRPPIGGDWELECLLGVGGFGEVWKAKNPHMSSADPVALKFCLDPAAGRVLKNEAEVLNRVMRHGKHPGIVQLLRTHLGAEVPCLEYEYIEGGDLTGLIQEWHRAPGGPPLADINRTFLSLCEIVGFAHRLATPIIHRDLKPANVLCQKIGDGPIVLKVADFGIGATGVTQHASSSPASAASGRYLMSSVLGSYTPLYASAQQMRGDRPTPADDVYALGVVWYQMLTGDLRQGKPGGVKWQRRLIERGMPLSIIQLLSECYEDRPEDRPADAAALHAALDRELKAAAAKAVPADPGKKVAGKSSGPADAADEDLPMFLNFRRWDTRKAAVEEIARRGLRHLNVELLNTAMHDEDEEVQAVACRALVGWGAVTPEWTREWAGRRGREACEKVLDALAEAKELPEALVGAVLDHPDAAVRLACWGKLIDQGFGPFDDADWLRRRVAAAPVEVATRIATECTEPRLKLYLALLDHADEGVRTAAITALVARGLDLLKAPGFLDWLPGSPAAFARGWLEPASKAYRSTPALAVLVTKHPDREVRAGATAVAAEWKKKKWVESGCLVPDDLTRFVTAHGADPELGDGSALATIVEALRDVDKEGFAPALRGLLVLDAVAPPVWAAAFAKLVAWNEITTDTVRDMLRLASPEKRRQTVRGVEQNPSLHASADQLVQVVDSDPDDSVRAEALLALMKVNKARPEPANYDDLAGRHFERLLASADRRTRIAALASLWYTGLKSLAPVLLAHLGTAIDFREKWQVYHTLEGLGELPERLKTRYELQKKLSKATWGEIGSTAKQVAEDERPEYVPILLERVRNPKEDDYQRGYCLSALVEWKAAPPELIADLLALPDSCSNTRSAAVTAVQTLNYRQFADNLTALARAGYMRRNIVRVLRDWKCLPHDLWLTSWVEDFRAVVYNENGEAEYLLKKIKAGLTAAGPPEGWSPDVYRGGDDGRLCDAAAALLEQLIARHRSPPADGTPAGPNPALLHLGIVIAAALAFEGK